MDLLSKQKNLSLFANRFNKWKYDKTGWSDKTKYSHEVCWKYLLLQGVSRGVYLLTQHPAVPAWSSYRLSLFHSRSFKCLLLACGFVGKKKNINQLKFIYSSVKCINHNAWSSIFLFIVNISLAIFTPNSLCASPFLLTRETNIEN